MARLISCFITSSSRLEDAAGAPAAGWGAETGFCWPETEVPSVSMVRRTSKARQEADCKRLADFICIDWSLPEARKFPLWLGRSIAWTRARDCRPSSQKHLNPPSLASLLLVPPFILRALALTALLASPATPDARYIPYSDAQPIVTAMADALPAALRGKPSEEIAATWPEWVRQRDAEVRTRLDRGDEDSLANLLLYGSSYTSQPRLTPEFMQEMERSQAGNSAAKPGDPQSNAVVRIFVQRVEDLARALSTPG